MFIGYTRIRFLTITRCRSNRSPSVITAFREHQQQGTRFVLGFLSSDLQEQSESFQQQTRRPLSDFVFCTFGCIANSMSLDWRQKLILWTMKTNGGTCEYFSVILPNSPFKTVTLVSGLAFYRTNTGIGIEREPCNKIRTNWPLRVHLKCLILPQRATGCHCLVFFHLVFHYVIGSVTFGEQIIADEELSCTTLPEKTCWLFEMFVTQFVQPTDEWCYLCRSSTAGSDALARQTETVTQKH